MKMERKTIERNRDSECEVQRNKQIVYNRVRLSSYTQFVVVVVCVCFMAVHSAVYAGKSREDMYTTNARQPL